MENGDKIKLATMEKDIQYIKKSVDSLNTSINAHITECDKKYADKWVEKAFIWGMQIVGGIILASIIGLVIVNQ